MSIACKTPLRAALAAALVLTAAPALAGEITLFQHRDFGGAAAKVHHGAADLDASAFNDTATSLVVREGVWEACTEANFQGRCIELQPGAYPSLSGSLGHSVASVREVTAVAAAEPAVAARVEPRLVLFESEDFGGSSMEVRTTTSSLERYPPYDGAAAAIVYQGTWRLCSEENSRGQCRDFGPGRYASLGPLDGTVRSVQLIAPGTPVATLQPVTR